jgi:hypothetical protein
MKKWGLITAAKMPLSFSKSANIACIYLIIHNNLTKNQKPVFRGFLCLIPP